MGDILNNLTHLELAAMREKALAKRKERACVWCAKTVSMRSDQRFCCPACKTAFARAAAELRHARLLSEQRAWSLERISLREEIRELRREIARLTAS